MQDLNAVMFYKAKFRIEPAEGVQCDLLWKVILGIRLWLTKKWNRQEHCIVDPQTARWTRFKWGGKFYDQENTNLIYAESLRFIPAEAPEKERWAGRIIENPLPEKGFAPREWTTEIGFEAEGPGAATLSYVVTYSDQPGFIGLCMEPPDLSVPRLIRGLFEDPELVCSIGPARLTAKPVRLSPGDYPAFEALLFDPGREIPIVYMSPCRPAEEPQTAILPVSPEEMALSVAGNALVYYADSPEFSSEMHLFGDGRYGCAGGAIRLFLPHADRSEENDPYRHRFLSARFIEEKGEKTILEIFRRALAQDVHFYQSMFRLDSCRALIVQAQHAERIARIRAQSEGDVDEAMREYLAESERREAAEQLACQHQEETDRLRAENYGLSAQLATLQRRVKQLSQIEAAANDIRSCGEYPNTPGKIARYFERIYPDRIAFTDRAYRSLEDCLTKPELLWEIFYHIATDLYELLHSDPAQAYRQFTQRTGWDCSRGEGTMTRADARLMRQYIDWYQGQEIEIEAHIKNGGKESDPRFVRIHFAYDPAVAEKVIIGHCGRHLDNFSTRRVK